jgi:uncharacterized protein YlxW (UPF0749 family)
MINFMMDDYVTKTELQEVKDTLKALEMYTTAALAAETNNDPLEEHVYDLTQAVHELAGQVEDLHRILDRMRNALC